jgi:hypothetical protein
MANVQHIVMCDRVKLAKRDQMVTKDCQDLQVCEDFLVTRVTEVHLVLR